MADYPEQFSQIFAQDLLSLSQHSKDDICIYQFKEKAGAEEVMYGYKDNVQTLPYFDGIYNLIELQ